jgi:AraC family transcriptional regulator
MVRLKPDTTFSDVLRKGYQARRERPAYSGFSTMKPDTRSFYGQAVQRVIERIGANLDEALDLHTLAGEACLSPFHFHRVFRGMVGETPLELIRRLRMERAAWTLRESDRAVTEIAFDAGYDTHEAFTRAFRACYSTSPSGFRRRTHRRIELAATCGVHFDPRGIVPAFIPRDSGGEAMDVEITQMPELRVATLHHVGPYNQIPEAFGRLNSIAQQSGLFRNPGAAMIAIYYDDPETTPQEQLRSDAAIAVPSDAKLPAGLDDQKIAGGRYARTEHIGPYEKLGDTWARFLGEWLPASGNRIGTGSMYEIYRNDPTKVAPSELRTELYISLA